ncbi:MAG: hypothetical protein ACU84Q_07550 [Gammaproteobacteria bacterium]
MSKLTNNEKAKIRYFDEVEVGDELDGFEIKLDWTAMVLQVQGSQDWNRIHHDPDYARDSGHQGIFYNTSWTGGLLGRALTEWAGMNGFVRKLSFQMRGMNMHDDLVHAKGEVTGKHVDESGRRLVEIELWLGNDRVGKTTPATALVELPD